MVRGDGLIEFSGLDICDEGIGASKSANALFPFVAFDDCIDCMFRFVKG